MATQRTKEGLRAYMKSIIKQNGTGAITGALLQDVLDDFIDSLTFLYGGVGMQYRGDYDASSNLFPTTGGSGASGAVEKGNIFNVSVTGTLGGEDVPVGGLLLAKTDAPGQTASNWRIIY